MTVLQKLENTGMLNQLITVFEKLKKQEDVVSIKGKTILLGGWVYIFIQKIIIRLKFSFLSTKKVGGGVKSLCS